ncbi:DNA-directed DNA polymerase [Lithospermum erythrorhizon]|uniref:DNA-directed DNA polymerase n=1 Tax=Lithospermum erythrorhizon TaxID=34254 RepID=A0AAV3NMX0_LITER
MEVEMRGGGGDGGNNNGGGRGFDPSNLHLRKELTQIKKAAKLLRDPGTTSSWRSPLSSARSAMQVSNSSKQLFYHNHNNHFHQYKNNNMVHRKHVSGYSNENNHDFVNNDGKVREKEKKVYLYNWKMQRSESEKSRQVDGVVNENVGGSSSTTPEESVEDSLSDVRNGEHDSKSDTYVGERYGSLISNCKDTNFTPSIRRSAKKRSKRNDHSSTGLRNHNNKLTKQIVPSKGSKGVLENLPGMGLKRDDLTSLVDQSDDTEDYYNLEELKKGSLTSPLLARLTNRNRRRLSTKFSRDNRKEDSSYTYSTPALSTSSFKKYYLRNPSTVGSWVATTTSLNDVGNDSDDALDFPGREGCGIPCYWSKRSTPKSRGSYASCFSPSLSDTLRRKGSSILCGSHSKYQKRRPRSSLGYGKRNISSRNAAQGLVPLLTNSVDGHGGSPMGSGNSDDELSTNFGELDLEAVNRLDGRRWSTSCRSREGLELMTLNGEAEEESSGETVKSLSYKYRPMFFEEMIGQNIVVHSLISAVSKARIAPVYLFQGPRGTGKTSAARIFAAALNCLASEESKPCGVCRECAEYVSGKRRDIIEIDGASKKAVDRIKYLLKNISVASSSTLLRYQVFVVDECHLLPAKTWLAFLKFLQEPPPRIVFILITTDLDNLPRTILSRCQKYIFNKFSDDDIVTRLSKIATEENVDAESDALDLIALNADGSLRDAETMLEQLSLFGKTITTSLVNELVGVVSDEKLLELLELALSSDTAETVKRARELLDSGIDPIVLMSQLASIIMDIIAGTHQNFDPSQSGSFLSGGSLTNMDLERLKHALKLLSDAEKQLRVSSERSTWFTATLLQLGSLRTLNQTHSGSSRRESSRATEEDPSSTYRETSSFPRGPRMSESPNSCPQATHNKSSSKDVSYTQSNGIISSNANLNQSGDGRIFSASQDFSVNEKTKSSYAQILENIWTRCIDKCHSKTLRQLMHTHGKLVSISQAEGVFVAYIAFNDNEIKTRVERFLSSITNAFEYVLRSNVEVNIVMLPNGRTSANLVRASPQNQKHLGSTSRVNEDEMPIGHKVDAYSDMDSQLDSLKITKGSFGNSESILPGIFESTDGTSGSKERKSEIPVHRIESIIHEQRLETAWLQAMEKGTPGSLSRLKAERNQILPQDGAYHHNQMESMNSLDNPTQHLEDDLNNELQNLKIIDGKVFHDDQTSKKDHLPLSPSLLHNTNFAGHFNKENTGYESGAGAGGCSGLLCWNNYKPHKRIKTNQAKQGTRVRSHKGGIFVLFKDCTKPRRSGSRKR